MADDAKAEEFVDELRSSFAGQLRKVLPDVPAHVALQLADSLTAIQLDVMAGVRVRYKAKPTVDGEAIAEDWRRGLLIGEVMAKHKCSRVTAYKYHPNQARRAG